MAVPIFGALLSELATTNKAAKTLQGTMQGLGRAQGELAQAQVSATHSTTMLTHAMTASISSLDALASPFKSLTELSNPAAVEAYTWALRDAQAVIGRGLLPIMNAMTRSMQMIGDTMARVEPIFAPVAQKFANAIERTMARLEEVWKKNGPGFELLAEAFMVGISAAELMARAIIQLGEVFSRVARAAGSLFGFTGSRMKMDASSKGAAVRQVSTITSAESISQRAIEKALMQGLNPGAKTQEDMPNLLDAIGTDIKAMLSELMRYLPTIPTKTDVENLIKQLPEMLAKALVSGGGAVGEAVGNVAGQVAGVSGGSVGEIIGRRLGDIEARIRRNMTL